MRLLLLSLLALVVTGCISPGWEQRMNACKQNNSHRTQEASYSLCRSAIGSKPADDGFWDFSYGGFASDGASTRKPRFPDPEFLKPRPTYFGGDTYGHCVIARSQDGRIEC